MKKLTESQINLLSRMVKSQKEAFNDSISYYRVKIKTADSLKRAEWGNKSIEKFQKSISDLDDFENDFLNHEVKDFEIASHQENNEASNL